MEFTWFKFICQSVVHRQQSSRNIGNRLFLEPSAGPSMVRLISVGCVFESVCHVSHALLLSGVCQKGLSAEIYPFLPVTEDLSAYGGTPAMCCCINSQASTGLSLAAGQGCTFPVVSSQTPFLTSSQPQLYRLIISRNAFLFTPSSPLFIPYVFIW